MIYCDFVLECCQIDTAVPEMTDLPASLRWAQNWVWHDPVVLVEAGNDLVGE